MNSSQGSDEGRSHAGAATGSLSQEAKIEGSVFDADNNVTKKLSIFSKVATEVFMF